jgi:hypothetical protein
MKKYGEVTLGIGVVLIGLSLFITKGGGPATWLNEWTAWVASYVALAVTARGVVKVGDSFAHRIRHGVKPAPGLEDENIPT